ncbi:MAG: hypothetical protein ACE5JD_12630 [Candidatus Methylomirabilia bacterium]
MDLLSQPFDPLGRDWRAALPIPVGALWPFALLLTVGAGAEALEVAPRILTRPLVVAGFHGGLLGGALGAAWGRKQGWQGPSSLLAALLLLAGASYQANPWGGVAYLLVPLALVRLGLGAPELRRIGWTRPEGLCSALLGAALGLFLGAHLLFSASRTLGYQMHVSPRDFLAAFAYDMGANVLSAELCIRGTLFNAWHRRWGFWPGALLGTGAILFRYLIDPSLPRTLEVTAGLFLYLSLLSLGGCALMARSGSVLPSLVSSLCFFGAYRTLHL